MSVAKNFCVAVLTFAIGIAASFAWTIIPMESNTRQHPLEANYPDAEFGTLKRAIHEAKYRGDKTVDLGLRMCGADIGSLQEVLSRDTVVLAHLVEKKTYVGTMYLQTWYRFKIRETLLKHRHPRREYIFKDVPSDMLPIAEDEFLISEVNGEIEIDGVTVRQDSTGAKYLEGQTYLLFLWIDPSKRTAVRTATDPFGVFLVDSNGNLSSYLDRPYSLKTALLERFNNSLNDLRQAVKK